MQTDTNRPALNPKHFVLLRIAKLRNLTAKYIGGGLYKVPSFSQRHDSILWIVNVPGMACSCPARGYCSHLAIAVDHHFINEASPTDYGLYTNELISDHTQLRLRIRANELTRNDKIYLAYCERFYRAKLAAAKVPAVVETIVREGRRTRTLTRCGAFTI